MYVKLLLTFLIVLQSCSTTKSSYSLVSNHKNDSVDLKIEKLSSERVEGESCISHFLFIPTALDKSYNLATKDALKDFPTANALSEVKIWESFFYGILYGFNCYKVSGVPTKI